MTSAQSWRGIAHGHDLQRRAAATSQRSGVAFEVTHRPIFVIPWSALVAGAAVWAFIGVVIAFAVAVAP